MDAKKEIKTVEIYNDTERLYKDLEEMGYSRNDPLKVEDVSKIDQLHYYGTDAVREAINRLGITSSHKVLDFGSGFGGPARFLASQTNCEVVALELQDDLHEVASDLTSKCGLVGKVKHVCGDILTIDIADCSFDFIVTWLVINHIEDHKTLFNNCFRLLKPGGKMFGEDLFKLSDYDSTFAERIRKYAYTTCLPSKDQYIKEMADAGFQDIQFEDVTSSFQSFVRMRYETFCDSKDRHVRVYGENTYKANLVFFSEMNYFWNISGHIGGTKVTAQKQCS